MHERHSPARPIPVRRTSLDCQPHGDEEHELSLRSAIFAWCDAKYSLSSVSPHSVAGPRPEGHSLVRPISVRGTSLDCQHDGEGEQDLSLGYPDDTAKEPV